MKKSLIVFWAVFLALSFEACNRSSINPEEEKAAAMADSIYGAITDIERLESLRDSLLLKNDILRLTFVYKQLGRCYRNNSQFADALRTHREGLNCAIERKDTVEIVRAYNHLGTDYRRRRAWEAIMDRPSTIPIWVVSSKHRISWTRPVSIISIPWPTTVK